MADCFIIRHKSKNIQPIADNVLYDHGVTNTDLTGGFIFKGTYIDQAVIVQNNEYIYVKTSTDTTLNFGICETSKSIDLTNYTKVNALVTYPTSNASQYGRFSISKSPIQTGYSGYTVMSDPIGRIGENKTVTLDVSSYTGNYYINLMVDCNSEMYIYKIWLE